MYIPVVTVCIGMANIIAHSVKISEVRVEEQSPAADLYLQSG